MSEERDRLYGWWVSKDITGFWLPDELKDELIAAGWLPPCEGRWTNELELGRHSPYLRVDFQMPPYVRRCRVTFDPLPEKGGNKRVGPCDGGPMPL